MLGGRRPALVPPANEAEIAGCISWTSSARTPICSPDARLALSTGWTAGSERGDLVASGRDLTLGDHDLSEAIVIPVIVVMGMAALRRICRQIT